MKTVILSGGEGRRLRDYSTDIPKPLAPIGGDPILWHIVQHYAHFGFREFILCLGYKSEQITEYFLGRFGAEGNYREDPDYTKHLSFAWEGKEIQISFVYTGEFTPTGGRIFKVRELIGAEPFFATYADGLSNIHLADLQQFHQEKGKIATISAFNPTLQYGTLDINASDEVTRFREKPRLDQWINGGFFVFQPEVFDYLNEDSVLEMDAFGKLAAEREIAAFRHEGFWMAMDTYKDFLTLEALWEQGDPGWRMWE